MEPSNEYTLVIKSYEDKDYRHVVATRPTAEELDRIENGVQINMNHLDYYTEIEPPSE